MLEGRFGLAGMTRPTRTRSATEISKAHELGRLATIANRAALGSGRNQSRRTKALRTACQRSDLHADPQGHNAQSQEGNTVTTAMMTDAQNTAGQQLSRIRDHPNETRAAKQTSSNQSCVHPFARTLPAREFQSTSD